MKKVLGEFIMMGIVLHQGMINNYRDIYPSKTNAIYKPKRKKIKGWQKSKK